MFDLRLIRAEMLKLRRRRGLMIATAVLTFGAVGLFYAIAAILHVADSAAGGAPGGLDGFSDTIGLLSLTGAVARVLVGATAGGADIEAGVFRDLAATGRSRTALFFARVPGAWAIVVPAVLLAVALSALLASAHEGERGADGGGGRRGPPPCSSRRCCSARRRSGSPRWRARAGMVIGVVLTFQLGLSPILAQVTAIGDARYAIPSVANARIGGETPTRWRCRRDAVVLGWAALTLGAGLWRTRTQEI